MVKWNEIFQNNRENDIHNVNGIFNHKNEEINNISYPLLGSTENLIITSNNNESDYSMIHSVGTEGGSNQH